MIWREKKWPLIILGVLLLGNIVFFFSYRVQYENRVRDLDARKSDADEHLHKLTQQRVVLEQQLASYRKTQQDLATIYNDRWATLPQRLTALINEVKRLAAASEMTPPSYTFSRSDKEASKSSTNLGTSSVGITFTVHGSYQQVRRLINLLELSDQFVIIDSVSLAGGPGNDSQLTLNLRLKTIFRDLPGAKPNKEM